MFFGNKADFAVELELDDDRGGHLLYGKFSYWIAGNRMGDYELGTSLYFIFVELMWIVHDCGKRNGERLCAADPQEVFYALDHSLYCSDLPESDIPVPEEPARFKILPSVEVFFEFKAFLIECGDEAHIIYMRSGEAKVTVAKIGKGIFDKAISEAYAFLNVLVEQQAANEVNPGLA